MKLENFKLADQIEVNVRTSQAVVTLNEVIKDGHPNDTLNALAFLAGYCKDEPVLINDIFEAIFKLVKEGKLER